MTRIAVHREPAWRERSDFILRARIDPDGTDLELEQLWGRRVDNDRFELCCIPFFLYDVALGDVVETAEDLFVSGVWRASGRYVFRVFFGEPSSPRSETVEELKDLGGLVEWFSPALLAVDARDQTHAQEIADYLWEQENRGRLVYETCKTA